MAAPKAMTSAMLGVPASNFQGTSFQVAPSRVTRRIISPPPRKGSISSRSSRRGERTPTPGGPHNLWGGEGEEVAPQRLDIYRHVRRALGAVHQEHGSVAVGLARQLLNGVDRAQRVGDVGGGCQP